MLIAILSFLCGIVCVPSSKAHHATSTKTTPSPHSRSDAICETARFNPLIGLTIAPEKRPITKRPYVTPDLLFSDNSLKFHALDVDMTSKCDVTRDMNNLTVNEKRSSSS